MKYKLKKDFPMCPIEIGGVVIEDKFGQYVSEKVIIFEKETIENYPEFWEKIEELEYEIISYVGTVHFIEDNSVKIHTAKRLFDGECFTIRDSVYNTDLDGDKGFEIKEINISENIMFLIGENRSCSLKYAKKIKKNPLFTTEDGVDIFESDFKNHANIYSVNKSNFSLNKNTLGFTVFTDACLKFSTKEKAEEYIIINKPFLSIAELQKWFMEYGIQLTGLERLKEIVKNKL